MVERALPLAVVVTVWLPIGAEMVYANDILIRGSIRPLPLSEFKRRFPTGGLVALDNPKQGHQDVIEIWHQKDGIFYKTTGEKPQKPNEWPWYVSFDSRIEGGKIVLHPMRGLVWELIFCIALVATAFSVFITALLGVKYLIVDKTVRN